MPDDVKVKEVLDALQNIQVWLSSIQNVLGNLDPDEVITTSSPGVDSFIRPGGVPQPPVPPIFAGSICLEPPPELLIDPADPGSGA